MIEIPGFAPSRRVVREDNVVRVYIKPPDFMGLPEVCVVLDLDQYDRYQRWRERKMLIQDALPELTDTVREMLMTGLADDDFHRICKEDDE